MATLYRNGRVRAPGYPGATAFVVESGRIAWLGDEPAAAELVDVRPVDLGGALVTPAFVDAHVHATSTGLALTGLDLRSARSLAEVLSRVEATARRTRGRPIIGGGWDESRWPERRAPTAAELDRASYGAAVYLARIDVHSAAVSSALLAAVRGSAELPGGEREGWVRGAAHDALRTAAYEAVTAGRRREVQRAALARAAELGIACVHEMAGPAISSADDLLALTALAAEEPLPEVIGYWAELHGVPTARELGAVGAAGDLFCDGSLGSHTAALHEPYADRREHRGDVRFGTDELTEHVLECDAAGLQAGFHAIGDAAIDQVLDAFETASARLGRPVGPGHRIEHAEFVRDPARLAACGLAASMQPCFDAAWGGSEGMYAQRLGPQRAQLLNRFADLAAAGVPLAFGSDAPVTELGPWAAVRAAVDPHDPSAGISPDAAFAAHTIGGWRAARRADEGELLPGRPATFAVWDAQPQSNGLPDLSPGSAIPQCLATVLRGVPIHDTGLHSGLGDT